MMPRLSVVVTLLALLVLASFAYAGGQKNEFIPFIEKTNIEPKIQGAISGQSGGVDIQARQIVDPNGVLPDEALEFQEGFMGLDFVGANQLLRNEKDLLELPKVVK